MRNYLTLLILFLTIAVSAQQIKWLSLAEAESVLVNDKSKPLLIEFYTNWCGFCKKMEQTTLKNREVIDYITAHFVPVKFDAETKEEVFFKGRSYRYIAGKGSRGVNSFAYFFLNGNLNYPSYTILDEKNRSLNIIAGFYEADKFIETLKKQSDKQLAQK